jgi:peroxiredoxin (alkyl hydroperoxide reductase subunit C)
MLVNQKAPDFTATAVMADNTINDKFNLQTYLNGSIGVLFFYPLDFTFVCPSEILAFNQHIKSFHEKGAKVIGVSVDSQFSHLAWKNTDVKKGGIGQVQFPLVADITKNIARDYDVLLNDAIAFRATFLIDQEGIVQHALINSLPLGRNIEETLRMVDALNFHQKNGEVCPANWQNGKKGMKPTPDGVASYLCEHESQFSEAS